MRAAVAGVIRGRDPVTKRRDPPWVRTLGAPGPVGPASAPHVRRRDRRRDPMGGRDDGVTGPRGPASFSHARRRDRRRDPTGGRDNGVAGHRASLFDPPPAPVSATRMTLSDTRSFQNVSRPKALLPGSRGPAASGARIVPWRQPSEMVNKLPFASTERLQVRQTTAEPLGGICAMRCVRVARRRPMGRRPGPVEFSTRPTGPTARPAGRPGPDGCCRACPLTA